MVTTKWIPDGWHAILENDASNISLKLWKPSAHGLSHPISSSSWLAAACSIDLTAYLAEKKLIASKDAAVIAPGPSRKWQDRDDQGHNPGLHRFCDGHLRTSAQLKDARGSHEGGITSLFQRARADAPCLLILENLDSLVDPKARAFLLNELDGFQTNDVKFFFELPALEMRQRFILKWLKERVGSERLQFDIEDSKDDVTEGWSYAFLQELFISFLLKLASETVTAAVDSDMDAKLSEEIEFDIGKLKASVSVMLDQLAELAVQVKQVRET
ncbi:hypothetical protein V8E36_008505 [Tilletia maclaganii]